VDSSSSSALVSSLSTKPDSLEPLVEHIPLTATTVVPDRLGSSTFSVYSPSSVSVPSLMLPRPSSQNPGYHVVMIGESLSFVKAVKRTLEKSRFYVTTVNSGKEALKLFQRILNEENKEETLLIHAIFVNLEMSSMNGLELIKHIRETEKMNFQQVNINKAIKMVQHRDPPGETAIFISQERKKYEEPCFINNNHLVIALSSSSDNETVNKAFLAGVNDFLPKPFKLQAFQQILLEFYSKRKSNHLTAK
jgi:CheY-like chemotaxis protein